MIVKNSFYLASGQPTESKEFIQVLMDDHPIHFFYDPVKIVSLEQAQFFTYLLLTSKMFPHVLKAFGIQAGDKTLEPGEAFILPSCRHRDWVPALFYRPKLPIYLRSYRTSQMPMYQNRLDANTFIKYLMSMAAELATVIINQEELFAPKGRRDGGIVMVPQRAICDWVPGVVFRPTIPDSPNEARVNNFTSRPNKYNYH